MFAKIITLDENGVKAPISFNVHQVILVSDGPKLGQAWITSSDGSMYLATDTQANIVALLEANK